MKYSLILFFAIQVTLEQSDNRIAFYCILQEIAQDVWFYKLFDLKIVVASLELAATWVVQ